jgi:acyl-[acyl-carrier-protein]-phospholipid O-acyltransferase / long-chain-fatty-acid--[acyl-carrier-protein] ligase
MTPNSPKTAFDPATIDTTLFSALLAAVKTHGADKVILEDSERQPMTYGRLVLGAMVLGNVLAKRTHKNEAVGVLLPNVVGLPVVLFGLNAFGRVAALLNFSAGPKNIKSAIQTGVLKTIITSRRFVTMGNLEPLIEAMEQTEVTPGKRPKIIYLEDIREKIGLGDKIGGLIRSKMAASVHRKQGVRPDQPAVILFTSGTEGVPKGVVLTNKNLVANARQIIAHAGEHFTTNDRVMNPLPMFHSFGLTAGTLMPILKGMFCFLYPSPLHFKEIPGLVADSKSTMMFSTDTFLQGYVRAAKPDDLKTLRFIVAGAEKVKAQTRRAYGKHGTMILEGYGATECAPVISCNVPSPNMAKDGTVGAAVPGMELRLEPVPGIDAGGRLYVRGPNVMAGYMLATNPGVLVPPQGGWHDTGDIVEIDANGLITISGRAKRFAKIGGEMVSLAAVETMIAKMWPAANHVVLSVPDPKRGETLVLVTEKSDADRDSLQTAAKTEGLPELWVPRSIVKVGQIPVLASGKIDFMATKELFDEQTKAA